MIDLADATAAPTSVRLGGEDYELYPLSVGDWGQFLRWVGETIRSEARQAVRDDELPDELKTELLRDAYQRSMQLRLNSPDVTGMLSDPAGIQKVIWLSLRKGRPQLKEEDVAKLALEMPAARELVDRIGEMSFPSSPVPDEGVSQIEKKTPPPRTE